MALSLSTDPAVQATAAARGGWSALQANKLADAEKLFQTARQLDLTGEARKVANTGLLRILFQQKKIQGVARALCGGKKTSSSIARVRRNLYNLGHAHFKLKQWPEALRDMTNTFRNSTRRMRPSPPLMSAFSLSPRPITTSF